MGRALVILVPQVGWVRAWWGTKHVRVHGFALIRACSFAGIGPRSVSSCSQPPTLAIACRRTRMLRASVPTLSARKDSRQDIALATRRTYRSVGEGTVVYAAATRMYGSTPGEGRGAYIWAPFRGCCIHSWTSGRGASCFLGGLGGGRGNGGGGTTPSTEKTRSSPFPNCFSCPLPALVCRPGSHFSAPHSSGCTPDLKQRSIACQARARLDCGSVPSQPLLFHYSHREPSPE